MFFSDEARAKIWQGVFEGLGVAIQNPRLWVYLTVALICTLTGEFVDAETVFPLAILYMTSCAWFPDKLILGIKSVQNAKSSFKAIQVRYEPQRSVLGRKCVMVQ